MDRQKEYVLRTVEERGVRFVRLWFTDVLGQLKSFAISPAELEAWTGRHRTTLARMEHGATRVDRAVWYLLLVLGGLHPWPAWAGWRTVGDAIYSPRDLYRGYRPEHLERAAQWRALACALLEERDHGDDGPTAVSLGDPMGLDPVCLRGAGPGCARGRQNRPGAAVGGGARDVRCDAVDRWAGRALAGAVAP